jgi:uncharacterized membrane protein
MDFKRTLIFAAIITLIDLPWVNLLMIPKYKKLNVFDINIRSDAAIVAYLCVIISYPLIISKFTTLKEQLIVAASIGFISYGIYAFTLAAIYNKYPMNLAIIETLWGTTLFTIATFLTYKLGKYVN